MFDLIKTEALANPGTCFIILGYAANVAWYTAHGELGRAWYWLAAAQITFSATWLMGGK